MATPVLSPEVVAFVPKERMRFPVALFLNLAGVAAAGLIASVGWAIRTGAQSDILGIPVRPTHGFDFFALAFLVAILPFVLIRWHARASRLQIERRLPDFLVDLAALHKAGLPLAGAVKSASVGNYGPLSGPVVETANQVRWGIPVLVALGNLRDRLNMPLSRRSLTVVIEAGRTGGNVPEVLEMTATNARAFVNGRESRRRTMSMYTIIMYVASFIFIGVTMALQGVFVPRMIEAFSGGGGGAIGFSVLPSADSFRELFLTAALVQGFGNGLVGGILMEGSALEGLRHSWIMMGLGLVGFVLMG